MSFYGLPPRELAEAMEHINAVIDIYRRNGKNILALDNLMVAGRNHSFMAEEKFSAAINKHCRDTGGNIKPPEINKAWRLHLYNWCVRNSLDLEGDLIECGVHMGLYSLVMLDSVGPLPADKTLYLYDTFEGLEDDQTSSAEQDTVLNTYDIKDWFERVSEQFSKYPSARLVKGRVPEVFQVTAPDKVAFLHLDLNSAVAEIGALDFLRERLTPGAYILMDDYGREEYAELHRAMNDWFAPLDVPIAEFPTGQGLAIWR